MAKNLMIFGAGASKGSDRNGTPPLGGIDLFNALKKFNPLGWGKIPPEYAEVFHRDFEEGMKSFSIKNPTALPPLQRAMACFFYKFIPKSSNLYMKIAEKIRTNSWNGAFATLNYERYLELALSSYGIRPIVGKESKSTNEVEICFPHGCCHFFCTHISGGSKTTLINPNYTTIRDLPIKPVNDPQQFKNRILNDVFPPVMSYFLPSKMTTSGVSFIKSQRSRFTHLVSDALKIAIIGLRVRRHDKHIWDPLSSTSAKIIYCSGESSGREFKKWTNDNRKSNKDIILSGYFFENFEEICTTMELQY